MHDGVGLPVGRRRFAHRPVAGVDAVNVALVPAGECPEAADAPADGRAETAVAAARVGVADNGAVAVDAVAEGIRPARDRAEVRHDAAGVAERAVRAAGDAGEPRDLTRCVDRERPALVAPARVPRLFIAPAA